MSKNTLVLVHEPGRVFETHDRGQCWEGPLERLDVAANIIDVNLALAELCCILPALSPEVPGRYPIFAVEAVEACEPGRPSGIGGVLLRMAYEPFEGLFHIGMNAGTRQGDLEWLSLGPASPEHYAERVLRISVLIAPTGLYSNVEDVLSGQDELFGELGLTVAGSRGLTPWGCHGASWRVSSGHEAGDGERSFPAGFGLSDVRVTLIDEAYDVCDEMAYTGQLDHLVSLGEEELDEEELGFEESVSCLLLDLAGDLASLSDGANAWARRAEMLAQETRELALRLPELPGEDVETPLHDF